MFKAWTPSWSCPCLLAALTACAGAPSDPAETRVPEVPPQLDTGRFVRALEPRPETGGVGWLEARVGPQDAGTLLTLNRLNIDVRPAGHMAAFSVEHHFANDGDALMEGVFRFTLPPDAVVSGLAMEIDGELMEGEFVQKDKARRTYEQIVDSMKDPALLEWEQGKTFKLRVFPIEPHSEKRVVLRYLAPIHHDDRGQPRVIYPLAAPAMQAAVGKVRVQIDGDTVLEREAVTPREVLEIALPEGWGGAPVLSQRRDTDVYRAVRVAPDWSMVPRPLDVPEKRQIVIAVDSSRSALEAWPLVRQSVRAVMSELERGDEVAVLVGDLRVRDVGGEWARATDDRLAAIDRALAEIEPDGASDLGELFERAGELLEIGRRAGRDAERQVIYLGDGTPTWGEIDDDELRTAIDSELGDASLFALALGRGPDTGRLRDLSGAHGGTAIEPTSVVQVEAFSDFLKHASELRRIEDVSVEVDSGADVALAAGATWFEGQTQLAYLRSATGESAGALTLSGEVGGSPYRQTIALATAKPGDHIDKLWASHRLETLASDPTSLPGAAELSKDEVSAQMVTMSREFGVLSRETSLLVLESEEAYERHQIERAQAARMAANADQDPAVSGRDLESLGGDGTSLSPGDLQPGDPEIRIPAPADARSVVAVFPFGETKAARWDEAAGTWTLRFLVADDTPAGTYDVQIRITHADGRVELTKATYTIDMVAPIVEVALQTTETPGSYRVLATQQLVADDAARERPEGVAVGDETPRSLDAKRVRVLMPDGQTLILRHGTAGRFERLWTPRVEIQWPIEIELTVTDRALNVRHQTITAASPRD